MDVEAGQPGDRDRVICKDGRVFHACEVCRKRRSRCDGRRPQCTSCQRRGVQCEYKAMRKRGRHGKRAADAMSLEPALPGETAGSAAAAAAAAASVAAVTGWTLAPPLHQPSPVTAASIHPGSSASAAAAAFGLLGPMPPFFPLAPGMGVPATPHSALPAPAIATTMASMDALIGTAPAPAPAAVAAATARRGSSAAAAAANSTYSSAGAIRPPSVLAAALPPAAVAAAAAAAAAEAVRHATPGNHLASALLESMDGPPHPHCVPGHHFQPRPSSAFLGSPGSPDSAFSVQAPVALRSLSANGTAPAGVFGMGSPLGMAPLLGPAASAMPTIGYPGAQHRQHEQHQQPASAAAAAVAAMAAFQLTPTAASTAHHHSQPQQHHYHHPHQQHHYHQWPPMESPGPMMPPPPPPQPPQPQPQPQPQPPAEGVRAAGVPERHPRRKSLDARAAASFVPPASVGRRQTEHQDPQNRSQQQQQQQQQQQPGPGPGPNGSQQRSGDWCQSIGEEEEVLSGLCADGADHFGRPVPDVSKYPLPAKEELDEHISGMFEYFYMGTQSLHAATFPQRVEAGEVSPVLVYAIMAVASRYSRKPSLHSLNGMAFLNGDRHAATACGLANILLSHSELATVDTVHGMLFLSVYFMGQGNMLKSRMYLVKAVCTARTMGLQHLDATFVPSRPMASLSGAFDRQSTLEALRPRPCTCPRTADELVRLETKRRIWWFLVFVDYFTANVMNVPLEIPPDSYCVRLPCSDNEWRSATLGTGSGMQTPVDEGATHDLGFGDRTSSAQQGSEYVRLNGFHDCHPPWAYRPGAFYQERLMVEFCDHLRRLNSLRTLAMRSFFHVGPVYVEERYPYLRQRHQFVPWAERLEKVKSAWSWLHLQLNKWLDSILLRFSEVIHQVTPRQFNRQYRHQYYYYLLAAHSTIIMSHEVILQLNLDLCRYLRLQLQHQRALVASAADGHAELYPANGAAAALPLLHQPLYAGCEAGAHAPPSADYGGAGGMALSEGLSEFALGTLGSAMAPLMALGVRVGRSTGSPAGGGGGGGSGSHNNSPHASSLYDSVMGSPHSGHRSVGGGSRSQSVCRGDSDAGSAAASRQYSAGGQAYTPGGTPAAGSIQRELAEMAAIAWDGCVSTAEQLASILRGKHPKFVLLGSAPLEVFHEQVRTGDTSILSAPGSTFNAPGTGPGADNPILSDPDFYMRLQPSTAWWMFLVAQVQVGHIKRLLKESEGNFKVSTRQKAYQARMAGDAAAAEHPMGVVSPIFASMFLPPLDHDCSDLDGLTARLSSRQEQMRPLSTSVTNSAAMLAAHLAGSAGPHVGARPDSIEQRADVKARAARMVRAYENLSCMVKVLEGMQQYWQCMDYIRAIQGLLKGSEQPLY